MIVGVDIRVLAQDERGGIPEYTRSLLKHLIPLDQKVHYKLFFSSRNKGLDFAGAWPNVELRAFRYSNRWLLTLGALGVGPKLDRLVGGVDVWWSPHMLPVSLSPGVPRVLVVHDLSFLMFPEFLSARRKLWHWALRPNRQFIRADKIIAVSHSTKCDLTRLLHVPQDRISVIHSGITPLKVVSSAASHPPFLLYLGVLEPRKNLGGILYAFEIVKNELKRTNSPLAGVKLVIAGPSGWNSGFLTRTLARLQWRDDVERVGFVDEDTKRSLLTGASVFVYPSFLEGFGFPPLEAMSAGVPVVAGANSSVSELLGDAAILIDPWQTRELALAVLALLRDVSLRKELARRGKARAQEYSWQESAHNTLNVIKSVIH